MPDRVLLDDLIFDPALFPRQSISQGNVQRLRQVRASGRQFDPIIACRDTRKIIDGVHRWTVARQVGDNDLLVEWRDYSSDAERFEAAARLNSIHGLALSTHDKLRVIDVGTQLGLDDARLADALAISAQHLRAIRPRFASVTEAVEGGGELRRKVALKASVRHLAGEEISPGQAQEIEGSAPGVSYLLIARQLRRGVELGLLPGQQEHPALHSELKSLAEALLALG